MGIVSDTCNTAYLNGNNIGLIAKGMGIGHHDIMGVIAKYKRGSPKTDATVNLIQRIFISFYFRSLSSSTVFFSISNA